MDIGILISNDRIWTRHWPRPFIHRAGAGRPKSIVPVSVIAIAILTFNINCLAHVSTEFTDFELLACVQMILAYDSGINRNS